MRALVVSNMQAGPGAPERGSFVRDQVAALRRIDGVEVELVEGVPGARGYLALGRLLRERRDDVDVVHAHFGLTGWPALAAGRGGSAAPLRAITLHGTDVRHPRSRRLTARVLPRYDLVAAVSDELAAATPTDREVEVLPVGVDLERFRPLPRASARERLGLPADEPVLLFPADPARAVKRFDRAREVAGDTRLLTLGDVAPADVPVWVNAASAVLVPSESEGFGLAVLEALACNVPVLATPVGEHPLALEGVGGTLCAPFDAQRWRAALAPHLASADPRIEGRGAARRYGTDAMAARVVAAWRRALSAR